MLTRYRADIRAGLVVAVALAAAGVLVGAAWAWWAPRLVAVVGEQGVFLADPEGQGPITVDARFALLGALAGLVSGAVVFLALAHRGVAAAIGLAVGGLAGSLVAWRLGLWLGPEAVSVAARGAAAGTRIDVPVELRATGTLLSWPLLAVATQLVLTSALVHPEPRGSRRGTGSPGLERPERSGGLNRSDGVSGEAGLSPPA
ncbi:MAG: ABC transporter permease [Actinomycetes bacterium]